MSARPRLEVGGRLGPYELREKLGEGGWGLVFKAFDDTRGVLVALKVLHPGAHSAARARFVREGKLASRLDHPNIVRVVDVGEVDQTPYLSMELLLGDPMSKYLGSARVPLGVRMGWLVQAARGLTAVHEAGLLHRDVKPSNLMILPAGSVKLIDFGFAKSVQPAESQPVLTHRSVKIGTPAYMAPEQLAGAELDARVDQFAWGISGFALVTGTRLRVNDPALPPPDALERRLLEGGADDRVAAALARAFRLPREERFASMREAGDALEEALAGFRSVRAPRGPVLYCPRCATPLDAERRCVRCDPRVAPRVVIAVPGESFTSSPRVVIRPPPPDKS